MITDKEIQRLSKLVKLSFNDQETAVLSTQLTNIIKMLDSLKEVDTTNIEPLTSALDLTQRFRHDTITVEDISDNLFLNTPSKTGDIAKNMKCFVVPKVIE